MYSFLGHFSSRSWCQKLVLTQRLTMAMERCICALISRNFAVSMVYNEQNIVKYLQLVSTIQRRKNYIRLKDSKLNAIAIIIKTHATNLYSSIKRGARQNSCLSLSELSIKINWPQAASQENPELPVFNIPGLFLQLSGPR